MSTEISSTPISTSKIEVTRADRTPVEPQQTNTNTLDQAIEARRKQFVEEIARQNGLHKGKLVIEKDTDTGRYVHSLIDPDSGEVIRQWPDEDWLKFARESGGKPGLWLNEKV